MPKNLNATVIAAMIGAALSGGLGFFLYTFRFGQGLIHHSYELQLLARGDVPVREGVIVYMDDASHDTLKQPRNSPWDRSLHARLIRRLTAAGARAVAFDIVFSDPDARNPQADVEMAQAMAESKRVVLAIDAVRTAHHQKQGILPIESLQKPAAAIGSAEALADSDLVVRRLHAWDDDLGIPSLSFATASLLKGRDPMGEDDGRLPRWINYYGPPNFLPSVSYADALDPAIVDGSTFRDKVVFVGARIFTKFAGERKDEYAHPFSYWMSQKMTGERGLTAFIVGVEIQATACLNLMRGDWLTRFSPRAELAWIVTLGIISGFALMRLRPVLAATLGLGGAVLLAVGFQLLFNQKLIWFPWLILLVQILFALASSIFFNSVKLYVQKRLYEQTLSLYLSPKLVKKFVGNYSRLLRPGAEEHTISIFFSDIADFTELSRNIGSEELAHLMNNYFHTAVSQCIHATDGTVVKYIGDAIFAFWNAPELQPDHAWRACSAALRFREQMWPHVNGRPVRTRIGIHTGLARVGNFGSTERVDYTALGENVNLASRLEGLNKVLGTDCVISGETLEGIGDRLVTRPLGLFQLKGFVQPIEVHELVSRPEDAETTRPWREAFGQALNDYRECRLQAAEVGFRRALELRPDDGPSTFYLARLEELRGQPLPAAWTPSVVMQEK